jgi:hypothetical protein
MITYTAFITTEANRPTGADPGLLIQANDEEDGQSHYQGDAARIDGPDFALADEDGELDLTAADRLLADAGFRLADSGWRLSGGQWAAKVEPVA